MYAVKEPQKINSSIPSFPVRWYMFFRRYPSMLFDFRFLFEVIFRRSPVLWNNFMEAERRRRSQEENPQDAACSTESSRKIPTPGAWRDDS